MINYGRKIGGLGEGRCSDVEKCANFRYIMIYLDVL